MSLRKKIMRLLLGSVMLAILGMSLVAIQSMYLAREHILNLNYELSALVATKTETDVAARAHDGLNRLAKARAEFFDAKFKEFKQDAALLAAQMTELESNPENYAPREILPPQKEKENILSTQLFWGTDADSGKLASAYQAAAIEPVLLALNQENKLICSAYIASEDGYSIVSDIYAGRAFDEQGKVNAFDAKKRKWYQQAKEQNAPILSDVTLDVIGGEWDITAAAPYYRKGEFAGVAGIDFLLHDVNEVLKQNMIGETGIAFLVTSEGKIIFSSAQEGDLATTEEKDAPSRIASLLHAMRGGTAGNMQMPLWVNGEAADYYIAYYPMQTAGFSLGLAISEEELIAPAKVSHEDILTLTDAYMDKLQRDSTGYFYWVLALTVLLLAVALFYGRKIASRSIEPLLALKNGVEKIAGGNLDSKIEVTSDTEEIVLLANSFNDMVAKLKNYIEKDREQTKNMARETAAMELAASIQQGMLPKVDSFAAREDFALSSTMLPAKMVGGDFYDFYLLDENHLVLTIADVSDKGVPAALFMMMAKTILKNNAQMMKTPDDLAAVLTLTNKQLAENNEEMMFVTVFLAMLDLTTGRLLYVNGGHTPPLVLEKQGVQKLPVKKNCVLGINDSYLFTAQEKMLAKGDTLVLYTDGVTEAQDAAGECFGETRLTESLHDAADGTQATKKILAAVNSYASGCKQSDDITILACTYKGRG